MQFRRSQGSYEGQVATLTKSVQQLEDLLRHSELEKGELLRDLQAVRELCSRLEQSRDQLQRQHAAKTAENDQVFCFCFLLLLPGHLISMQHIKPKLKFSIFNNFK